MSDSEDDWFEKDIDDFVVDTTPKGVEIISTGVKNSSTEPIALPNAFIDGEYGGSYNISTSAAGKKSSSNQKNEQSTGTSTFIQPMSFKKLSYLLDQEPLNIFLDIIQTDSGFIETLSRSNISTEMIILTIRAILKMIETPFTECVKNFLNDVCRTKNYWKQIENVLKDTTAAPASTSTNAKQKKKGAKIILHKNDQEIWQHVINLCNGVDRLMVLPSEFVKNVLTLIEANKNESLNLGSIQQSFTQWKLRIVENVTPSKEKNLKEMEIYPTLAELLSEPKESYVKANLVKGRFQSAEHYLDVQLSLLREDFVAPLRDGILDLIEQAKRVTDEDEKPELHSNLNVRVYPNVRILLKLKERSDRSNYKSEHLIVDLEPKTRIELISADATSFNSVKYAKKLMYGSLLCFTTSPTFDDLIIAVVSNRDVDMLNAGYIQIEIVRTYNITKIFEQDLIMCESEVYFESYRHVYHVLRSFTEETFPMKNYIINVESTPQFPNYIPPKGRISFTYKQHTLDLKNTSTWPPPAAMKLNEGQVDALKHALTRKFSVIQGPPGCGKTFVGLQIIATLLMNTDSQVLVVCYTNHALDQFLTGLMRYTDSIVRVGNQSKNEILDRFNLKQLCESGSNDKRVKTSLFKLKGAYAEAVQEFENLHRSIQDGKNDDDQIFVRYQKIQSKLQSISRMQEEIKQIGEYQMINTRRIVGITSTGAARCNSLIRLLQPPIVIFEESAEILESHVVAALTKSVQQLILIGDHQQLRPTTSVYKLARQYHMDVSLFERMINNNLHCVTLNTQYRMRPEIANLIRPMIYKDLVDNENVHRYPDVVGMEKNLFFIDHTNLESSESDETTKRNAYESQYLVALCNYLVIQGYNPEDITILTTYNGQIFQFSQDRKKYPNLRKVRITVVDNYQGEDNKIILLSLVRSNDKCNIGYLAFKNRICVALSRAKHGLYIIGNMTNLRQASPLWNEIAEVLGAQNEIGTELSLKCSSHENVYQIKEPSDFDELKYGGCTGMCDLQMQCGHSCTLQCHTLVFEHFTGCQCLA